MVDNASIPEVIPEIKSLAAGCDCQFEGLSGNGLEHHTFLAKTLHDMASGESAHETLVFIDPDVCFWKSCEDFSFHALIAGRRTSGFKLEKTKTITMPRLHTSFLWIPDPKKLMREIWRLRSSHFDFEPFIPFSFVMDGMWYRYDTGASLYAALSHKAESFAEDHLNRYDHIYCGSHLDWLSNVYDAETEKMMKEIHTYAKEGDLIRLKGIWKKQVQDFSKITVNH